MKTTDLISSATGGTLRARTRSILTLLALFVGAFTLTLTAGVGTGVSSYIDQTVDSVGSPGTMQVSKAASDGVSEYQPGSRQVRGQFGSTVESLSDADIEAARDIPGVIDVEAQLPVTATWASYAGQDTQFFASITTLEGDLMLLMAAGEAPSESTSDFEVVLPDSYREAFSITDADAAVGQTLTIGFPDAQGVEKTVQATVVGIAEPTLAPISSPIANTALAEYIYKEQTTGLSSKELPAVSFATLTFDPASTDEQVQQIRDDLTDLGLEGATSLDRLGLFETVINAITLLLSAFAVIALIAAGFGIVNTLYMSVQERTREIGLMKALGMGSGSVFTLFSLEALLLGVVGAGLGAAAAIATGTILSQQLTIEALADLPGLSLFAVDPVLVVATVALIGVIALLAGTLPAWNAARKDPITALRYE